MAYKWKPLQPATIFGSKNDEKIITATMAAYQLTREEAVAKLDAYDNQCTYWRNDIYQVQVRPFYNDAFKAEMLHINIRRVDGAAVFDWRHRQLIKNQMVGDECEAFEIYPAESRLVDTSNKYHLWAFTDPTIRMPVAIDDDGKRDVVEHEIAAPPGMRQRRV